MHSGRGCSAGVTRIDSCDACDESGVTYAPQSVLLTSQNASASGGGVPHSVWRYTAAPSAPVDTWLPGTRALSCTV